MLHERPCAIDSYISAWSTRSSHDTRGSETDDDKRHDCIPGGQRQSEDAQRNRIASHDLDVLQLLQEILRRPGGGEVAGAIGRPRPPAPFHTGVIGAQDRARCEHKRDEAETDAREMISAAQGKHGGTANGTPA